MSVTAFFRVSGDTIQIQGRFESEDGIIGDYKEELTKGTAFMSFSFDQLFEARGGSIIIDDFGRATLAVEPPDPT